jgi:hypothetical protein
MTIEELAAAGLLAKPVVQNPEIAQPPEGQSPPAVSGLGVTKKGRSGQTMKTSEMLMPKLRI